MKAQVGVIRGVLPDFVTGVHKDSVRRWNLWFPSAGVFAEVLAGRATMTQITLPSFFIVSFLLISASIHHPLVVLHFTALCILHCALLCELNDDDDDDLTITISEIKRDTGRKSSFFHTPLHSTPLLGRFPSE